MRFDLGIIIKRFNNACYLYLRILYFMTEVDEIDIITGEETDARNVQRSKRLCRKIMEMYLSSSTDMREDLAERVQGWICEDRNWDVKDEVLMEFFEQCCIEATDLPNRTARACVKLLKNSDFPRTRIYYR